eukprot:760108-Pleurochrysis_carterae.AAC.1
MLWAAGHSCGLPIQSSGHLHIFIAAGRSFSSSMRENAASGETTGGPRHNFEYALSNVRTYNSTYIGNGDEPLGQLLKVGPCIALRISQAVTLPFSQNHIHMQ